MRPRFGIGSLEQWREPMKKKYVVDLSEAEREELSGLVTRKNVAAKKRTHAQILLLADVGARGSRWKDEPIAEACQVTVRTVENVRKRLVLEGMQFALNRRKQVRPSRRKILDGEVELEIVDSVSHETVRQCLKKTN